MHRSRRMSCLMVAAMLAMSGCFGPFNLTRRLYRWNTQVQGKWEREFMFILLAWAPVYGLTLVGDAVVFNSLEFWTGNNPVDPPPRAGLPSLPQTKRIVRGDEEAVLTYTMAVDGPQLTIQQFRAGQPAGTLQVKRRDGKTIGLDGDGHVVLTAESFADGRVLVTDGHGQRLASYPGEQVERSVYTRLGRRLAQNRD